MNCYKKTKEEHLYQGRLHSVKGEYNEAIEEYKKALEIDPNYKPVEVNLAFISYMKGPLNKDKVAPIIYEITEKEKVKMPTPDEREILKIIEEEGGECSQVKVANGMDLRLEYVRLILNSMGTRDYIDVFRSGKVRIADKGWQVLGKSPRGLYGTDSIPDETPEERFKRYMSR